MNDLQNPGYILIPETDAPSHYAPPESTELSPAWTVPLVPLDDGRIGVAAFDFDGTCIKGNSPVLLVRYLGLHGMLRKSVLAQLVLWGGAYKARLPQNERWVRGLVFSAFEGKPAWEVDRFLAQFYDQIIARRFRSAADEAMRHHALAGHAVVLVSASFEPIIVEAMKGHYVRYQLSTRMAVDDEGRYTDEVDGDPCAGNWKVDALTHFCDQVFGADRWRLGWAYGDHHSDRFLLSAAEHAFAVTPDRPLTRLAKREGWPILEWSDPAS